MDRLIKVLVVIAGVVMTSSGAHYLWSAYQTDLIMKYRGGIVVAEAMKCIAAGACTESEYTEAINMCVKRGYPL